MSAKLLGLDVNCVMRYLISQLLSVDIFRKCIPGKEI